MSYEETAQTLLKIIIEFSLEHPEIQTMDNPYYLFEIEGFTEAVSEAGIEHLATMAMARIALRKAQL